MAPVVAGHPNMTPSGLRRRRGDPGAGVQASDDGLIEETQENQDPKEEAEEPSPEYPLNNSPKRSSKGVEAHRRRDNQPLLHILFVM